MIIRLKACSRVLFIRTEDHHQMVGRGLNHRWVCIATERAEYARPFMEPVYNSNKITSTCWVVLQDECLEFQTDDVSLRHRDFPEAGSIIWVVRRIGWRVEEARGVEETLTARCGEKKEKRT